MRRARLRQGHVGHVLRVPVGVLDDAPRRVAGPEGARQVHPGVVPRLERRDARARGVVPVPDPQVTRPQPVVALHGRVDRVAVLVRLLAARQRCGLLEQQPGVALDVRGEGRGAHRPVRVVVARLEEGGLQLRRPHLAAQGPLVQPLPHGVVRAQHRLRCRTQVVHLVVLGDPAAPVLPAALEADVLVEVVAVPDLPGVGVDHTVEDHPADVAGEERRVHRPEVGPVGGAHVGELLLAEPGAQHVQVTGVVGGRVVAQRGPRVACAALRVRLRLGGLLALERLGGAPRALARDLGVLRRVLAGQRRRAPYTARRVADEVVRPCRPAPAVHLRVQREVHAGRPGTARIEDERALALLGGAGGAGPAHGQGDLLVLGAGVVQRDGEPAALHAGRQVLLGGAAAEGDAGRGGRRGLGGGPGGPVRGDGDEGGQDQRPEGAVQRYCFHKPSLRMEAPGGHTKGMVGGWVGLVKHRAPVSGAMPPTSGARCGRHGRSARTAMRGPGPVFLTGSGGRC